MDKTDACALIDREIQQIFNVPLTHNSVDLLYRLTTIRMNMNECEFGRSSASQDHVQQPRNRKDINAILEKYIIARKNNDDCVISDALIELLDALSDLVVEIYRTAKCENEREIISRSINKMSMH